MTKKEILALSSEALNIEACELLGWTKSAEPLMVELEEGSGVRIGPFYWLNPEGEPKTPPDYPGNIGAAMTDLFESVYGRGGAIKGGAWVLSTVEGGRDVASATLMWKAQSGQKHRANKVTVIRPRGEMAKAITQCWVCAMLGVSDG